MSKRHQVYHGMAVHKEATVIAVLNGSGKLVLESIVETKASSIQQFYPRSAGQSWHNDLGRRDLGGLAIYDLLQLQVTRVLVCDPRRNAAY